LFFRKKSRLEAFIVKRKIIQIGIVDDEDYQKNEVFYVELGEPFTQGKGLFRNLIQNS
jgi:hypothetical protein